MCRVNSKDLKRIEFTELGNEGAVGGVGDAGGVVVDMIEAAVDVPCADRVPTDGTN